MPDPEDPVESARRLLAAGEAHHAELLAVPPRLLAALCERLEAAEQLITDPYDRELTPARLDSYIMHGTMGLPRNILYAALLRAKQRLHGGDPQ